MDIRNVHPLFNAQVQEPQQTPLRFVSSIEELSLGAKAEFLYQQGQRTEGMHLRRDLWQRIHEHADISLAEKDYLKDLAFHPERYDETRRDQAAAVLQSPAALDFGLKLIGTAMMEARAAREMVNIVRHDAFDRMKEEARFIRDAFSQSARVGVVEPGKPVLMIDPKTILPGFIAATDKMFLPYFNEELLAPLQYMDEARLALSAKARPPASLPAPKAFSND